MKCPSCGQATKAHGSKAKAKEFAEDPEKVCKWSQSDAEMVRKKVDEIAREKTVGGDSEGMLYKSARASDLAEAARCRRFADTLGDPLLRRGFLEKAADLEKGAAQTSVHLSEGSVDDRAVKAIRYREMARTVASPADARDYLKMAMDLEAELGWRR